MKVMLVAAATALALGACTQQQPEAQDSNEVTVQRPSDQESQAYIDEAEQEWAALATKNDPSVLERILADDYAGVSGSGAHFNKRQEIEDEAKQPDKYVAASVPAMNYRHFGDTIVAQGDQTLVPKAGGPRVRILWTDVWMFRDGKWQVVASQNAVVPPAGGQQAQ